MKKLFFISLMLAVCGLSAMAQKGRDGIGGNIAWNLYNDSGFGLGVKYQYNLSDIISETKWTVQSLCLAS